MSDDIATLGLAIDSSQVTQASAALDSFTDSSTAAASAVDVLNAAHKNSATLLGTGTTGMLAQREALRGLAADLALFGGQLGQTTALAATLYLGNERLFNNFGELKSGLLGLLTPTNLMIGGFLALAATSYAAVTSIVAQEKAFDDLSDRSDTTSSALHSLADAASFKGVDQTEFLKDMTQFASLAGEASNNMGTLAELFRANGVAAGSMVDDLMHVADLVKNAATDAEKYRIAQEAGLPTTRQWIDFLSQGADGIKAAEANTVLWSDSADKFLVNKARDFDQEWSTAWTNFKSDAQNAVIQTASWFDQLGPKIRSAIASGASIAFGQQDSNQLMSVIGKNLLKSGMGSQMTSNTANQFYKSTSSSFWSQPATGGGSTTTDPAVLKNQIQNVQQLIGLLGPLASIDQQVQEKENQINLARLNGVTVTNAQKQAILDYTRETALGITQITSQTDALDIQTDSFGMLAGQAAAYAAVQSRIDTAIALGHPLLESQIEALRENAAELGDSTQRLDNMRTASDALSSGMKTFEQDLEQNKSAWTALKDAAVSSLNSISDKLIDMASKNLVSAAFGGTNASSGGGLLSGLFGGLFGGAPGAKAASSVATGMHSGGIVGTDVTFTRNVPASVFDGVNRYHTGDIIAPDEVPTITKVGEGVFTAKQMAAMAPVSAMRQQPTNVNITQKNDFTNADPGSEARIRAGLQATKDQAVTEAVQTIVRLQRDMPNVMRPHG